MPEEAVTQRVNSYFVHFHRSFPILHRPTFSLSAVPVSLLRVVVAIGSLYTASNLPLPERQPTLKEADENWERSRKELKSLVRSALAQRTLQLGVEVHIQKNSYGPKIHIRGRMLSSAALVEPQF